MDKKLATDIELKDNPLKFLRNNFGFKGVKKEIAEKLNVHPQTLTYLERDRIIIRHLLIIEEYSKRFNMPIGELCERLIDHYKYININKYH